MKNQEVFHHRCNPKYNKEIAGYSYNSLLRVWIMLQEKVSPILQIEMVRVYQLGQGVGELNCSEQIRRRILNVRFVWVLDERRDDGPLG